MTLIGARPEAQEELDAALANSANPIAFQDKVDAALADIVSGLMVYPRFGATIARECPLHDLPYSMIYTDTNQVVQVIAFAHHKRQPGYWMRRLRRS